MEDKDKSIAYEMAMLVKENRELKQAIKEWADRYNELDFEYEELRNRIEREKEKARKKKEPKERKLFDVPYDLKPGSNVMITDTSAKTPTFAKGFVLQIKSITKNESGVVTIKGKYLYDYASWKEVRMQDTIIKNVFYNWVPTDADLSTLCVQEYGEAPTYKNLQEVK